MCWQRYTSSCVQEKHAFLRHRQIPRHSMADWVGFVFLVECRPNVWVRVIFACSPLSVFNHFIKIYWNKLKNGNIYRKKRRQGKCPTTSWHEWVCVWESERASLLLLILSLLGKSHGKLKTYFIIQAKLSKKKGENQRVKLYSTVKADINWICTTG